MKTVCYIDFEDIFELNQNVWLVCKSDPINPLYKIPAHIFKTIVMGIYSRDEGKTKFSLGTGHVWVGGKILEDINSICSKNNIPASDTFFSMREFIDRETISKSEISISKLAAELITKTPKCEWRIFATAQTKRAWEAKTAELTGRLKEIYDIDATIVHVHNSFFYQDENEHIAKANILLKDALEGCDDIHYFSSDRMNKKPIVMLRSMLRKKYSICDETEKKEIKQALDGRAPSVAFHRFTSNIYSPIGDEHTIYLVF